jgi:hypothetical protein
MKPTRLDLANAARNAVAGITNEQINAVIEDAVTGASMAQMINSAQKVGLQPGPAVALGNALSELVTPANDRKGLGYSSKDRSLHYMVANKNGRDAEIKSVDVGDYKELLQAIGRMRFDTKFVRNLFWLTNIQRLLRLKMRQELNWFDSKIVSEHAVLAPSITEYSGNRTGPLNRFME